jgi:hypothetical protein
LVGAHHFYVTFKTGHTGVSIPDYLKLKYPDEMTIVLQYQFYNLKIEDEFFSVSLSFNNTQEHLVIPFAAITGFADPSVKFGLQFQSLEDFIDEDEQASFALAEDSDDDHDISATIKATQNSEQGNNVVSLDSFRKK